MVAGLLLAVGAGAAPSFAAGVTQPPDWKRKPSGELVSRYYPNAALSAGISGKAVLSCKIAISGAVDGCRVESEDPPGYGFGEAAKRIMAEGADFTPATVDGKPVEWTIKVPLSFTAPVYSSATYPDLEDDKLLQCLGYALDDAEQSDNPHGRKAVVAWYQFAGLGAIREEDGPIGWLDRIDDAWARARRMRDDPKGASERKDCQAFIARFLPGEGQTP